MNSIPFFTVGDRLQGVRLLLEDEHEHQESELSRFLELATGFAIDSFASRHRPLIYPVDQVAGQLSEVTQVLLRTARAAELLEKITARVEPFLDVFPPAQMLLESVQNLSTALDVACAMEIEKICTPALPTADISVSNLAELSVDELHELNLLSASEEIRRLAEEHSDLRLLETIDGGMVAAVGDLNSAETITTFVAGVSSSDPAGWSTHIDRTRVLATAVGGARSAGIVWLGYRAPDNVVLGVHSAPARKGGADLSRFQRNLDRFFPGARKVVAGYSYGSVVVGEAAREKLHADDVILIGSPGIGLDSADDLNLTGKNPRVFAFTAPGDPIGLVGSAQGGIHGPDPTSPYFGAISPPVEIPGGHSAYFENQEFMDLIRKTLR